MPSIFTRIINGEIPCYKIAENEHCFAFLDIGPISKGPHTRGAEEGGRLSLRFGFGVL